MTGLFLGAWVVTLLKRYFFEGKLRETEERLRVCEASRDYWRQKAEELNEEIGEWRG